MKPKRSFMVFLFVILLFIPILSEASEPLALDRMLADARQNEVRMDLGQPTGLDYSYILKSFIAFDSLHNNYLLVYFRRKSDENHNLCYQLCGQLVNYNAEPIGEEFPISSGGFHCSTSGDYWAYLRADVMFDRANRHFLVVWPDFRTGKGEIFGQFVACDGSLIGAEGGNEPNFRISSNAFGAGVANLAFDPQKKRYLVVWSNFKGEPYYLSNGDICARFVNSSAPMSPLADSKEIVIAPSSTQQVSPAVAFDRHNRNYLVVWRDNFESGSFVKGHMLDESGNHRASTAGGFKISEKGSVGVVHPFCQPEVGWEPGTHRFLVAWTTVKNGASSLIHGQIVNPNGTLYHKPGERGDFVIAYSDTKSGCYSNMINPNVMFDPTSGCFLTVFTGSSDPLGQYVATDGTLVGTSAEDNFVIGADDSFSTFNKAGLAYNSRCGNFMVCWAVGKYVGLATVGDSGCADLPVVETGEIKDVTGVSATCDGRVVLDGGLDVTAKGVCWGTAPDPDLQGNHTESGSGLGSFQCLLTNLSPNTTYYVRAYATSSGGTGFGAEKTFTTPNVFDVTFSSQNGGSLYGERSQKVQFGNATSPVRAVANKGFFFTGWTGNGNFGFTMANPLTVNDVKADMTITAGFSPIDLKGERIVARGQALKKDIGEIDISASSIDPTLPLTFKLYRSINGVGRQLISQFTASELTDGHHHVLDEGLTSGRHYEYVVEVFGRQAEKIGESRILNL